ncbi:hypothetical protein OF83DRAFT_1128394 [Amylostereum chailletii]|nr:hypothetical protein OF83DRAFT_1128394 [Amylostereum chailletii]
MNADSSFTTEPLHSPHPAKRPRTDPNDDNIVVVVHSPDIWLSDGSIGTPKVTQTLYKVHKSTLAIHSSFFRDLFDGPQAALEVGSEQYEGLPVMDMPDKARDVEDFLRAIYLPDYVHRHGLHTSGAPFWSDFPRMYLGTLRLAKKYDAPKIRKVIVDAIKKEWPTELRYWDERQRLADEDRISASNAKLKRNVVYPEPAYTIRAAVDYGIPEILPAAYYDLFRVYHFQDSSDPHYHAANIRILTVDELHKLTVGMAALRRYVLRDIRSIKPGNWEETCSHLEFESALDGDGATLEDHCYSPCTSALVSWWSRMLDDLIGSSDPLDNLKTTGEWIDCDEGSRDLEQDGFTCTTCRESIKTLIEEKRNTLWLELPSYFNLVDLVGANWGGGVS